MKVAIAGEMPFVGEIGRICQTAGHDVVAYLVEDFPSAVQSGWQMPDAVSADIAIEVHNESAHAKEELIRALSAFVPQETLILTSAMPTSTTQAASWVPNPQRVVGFGLVPPILPNSLVELAPALQTDSAYLQKAIDFWQGINMEPVQVADGPGLVRARTVCCLINEAASALLEDVATPADIDLAMKLGTNYPHGPLAWADQIGLDAVLGTMVGLYEEWGEDRYRPSPLLRRLVTAGYLGQKTGRGFYEYDH